VAPVGGVIDPDENEAISRAFRMVAEARADA
jgi:hypothetical protein